VILAADHSKIGVRSRASWCDAERIDVLVTDRKSEKSRALAAVRKAVGEVALA
jgi:DeoR/GlpR family transcriptional regulator of sugar metabolism